VLSPLDVTVVSWVGSGGLPQFAETSAVFTSMHIYVNPRFLASPVRDVVIAYMFAYNLLWAPSQARSMAHYYGERQRRVVEANFKAVEVLTRVKGWSERASLEQVYNLRLGQHRSFVARGKSAAPGDVAPCEQIRDLLGRFPRHREWMRGRECAPDVTSGATGATDSEPGAEAGMRSNPDEPKGVQELARDVAPHPPSGRIHLASGAFIEADTWWEEGTFLFYSRSGTTAGVPRSQVIRIEGTPGPR
jgi:hypothetical protein